MNPKFRVFMNDTSESGTETDWLEIHGQNGVFTKENTLVKPKLELEVNTAGKFEFTLPECHNQYSWPIIDKTMVEVYELAPNITTVNTDLYSSDDQLFNTPVSFSVNNPIHPDFVDISIRYDDVQLNANGIAAVQQKFSITQSFAGETYTNTKYVESQGQGTAYFRYAFMLKTGVVNTFTIQSCGEEDATVYPEIKIFSEHTEKIPVYKSIFYGRVSEINSDFYNNKVVKCEGALAFLNDVVIRNEKYGENTEDEGSTTSVKTFIETFFDYYNKGGGDGTTYRTISVPDRLKMDKNVTYQPSDFTKYVYRNVTYENAFDVFSKKIIGAEGGYFLMVRQNLNVNGTHPDNSSGTGWKYIVARPNDPYPAVIDHQDFQAKAKYSMNITDLKKIATIDDIVTTVVPIGKYDSEDVNIKNSEYLNKSIKLYDDKNGSVIYDSNNSNDELECNYMVTDPDAHIVKYTYFALYDPVGGCRIWVNSSTGGVTLGWYVTLQQGVRVADKTKWNEDMSNPEQAPSPQLARSIAQNVDTTFSIGTGQYSGINYRTIYGWNYFVIMTTDPDAASIKKLRFNRLDRDVNDSTAGAGTNNKYLLDYIQDPDLAEIYGNKSKVVEFNDITASSKSLVKKKLTSAAVEWLNNQIYVPDSLEVNAVDMTYLARNGEDGHYPFMLGEGVEIHSDPHNVSTIMTITKLSIDMDSAKTIVTLGTPKTPTLTEYYRTKKKGEYTKEYVINDNT